MKKDFNTWLHEFKDTIAVWGYYTDFEKVYKHASSIKVELNILNSLIGSKNIEYEFRQLVNNYPNVLKVIPILIAKREKEIVIQDADVLLKYRFDKLNYSIDDYVRFMDLNGLFDLISNRIISNLYDYVLGVETGMDTHARKNRTGNAMESLIESYLLKFGLIKGETYWKQMYKSEVEKKFNIDLSNMSDDDNRAEKRFDFVVKISDIVYGIECNFYNGPGSKLNEVARSYKAIALETKDVKNFKFVWFTDGINGWKNAKNNLKEAFDVLDDIYNLKELENGLLNSLLK